MRTIAIVCALLSLLSWLPGCSPGEDSPERNGQEKAAEITFREAGMPFDSLLRSKLNGLRIDNDYPGVTAAYVLKDGTVNSFSLGYADLERDIPMTGGHRMLAGSVGKTFVSALFILLEQEARLNFDDPISKWLADEPWFNRLPNHGEITVRMLLAHRSGIMDHVDSPAFARAVGELIAADPDSILPARELIAFVLDRDPLFPAGEGYAYTDTGYILLELILEEITGGTFYGELRERILEPFELRRTTPADRRDLDSLAAGYLAEENELGFPRKMIVEGALILNPGIERTGGGLISHPLDLAKWASILYDGRLTEQPYMEELLAPEFRREEPGSYYGLGVSVNESPFGISYGHNGWFPGYRTQVAWFPEYKTAVAVQVNTDVRVNAGQLIETIMEVVSEYPGNR